MLFFVDQVAKYLIKYYNITQEEAEVIVNDEWEYIEEFFNDSLTPKDVAKKLVNIYMVA